LLGIRNSVNQCHGNELRSAVEFFAHLTKTTAEVDSDVACAIEPPTFRLSANKEQIRMHHRPLITAFLFAFACVGCSLPAHKIPDIQKKLHAVTVGCSQRVWPGYDWKKRQVLIIDGDKAILWNDQRQASGEKSGETVKVSSLDSKTLPSSASEQLWTILKVGGKRTLALSLVRARSTQFNKGVSGKTPPAPLALLRAYREGFRAFGQSPDRWKKPDKSRRFAPYPLAWKPSYLREQTIRALQRALFENSKTALAEAAYWQQRLKKEHEKQLQEMRFADVVEGSAQYVEAISAALAMRGCNASEADLLHFVKAHRSWWDLHGERGRSSQASRLGFVAGLLLRRKQLADWQRKVEQGTTPLELLLEGVAPRKQTDDPALMKTVEADFDKKNAAWKPTVDRALGQLIGKTYVRLAIWVSMLSFRGAVYVDVLGSRLLLHEGYSAKIAHGISRIELKKVTAFLGSVRARRIKKIKMPIISW
jgi:hypothetical protein